MPTYKIQLSRWHWRLGFVHPSSKVCNLTLSISSCFSHNDSQASFFHFWKLKSHACVCDTQNCNICNTNVAIICYCENTIYRAYIPLLKNGRGKVGFCNQHTLCISPISTTVPTDGLQDTWYEHYATKYTTTPCS